MGILLRITDGTNTVDLVATGSPVRATSWFPAIQEYKDGGVWQGGAFADGKRLVAANFDDAVEVIELVVSSSSQVEVINELRKLRQLLENASRYWTSYWVTTPVWIEARAEQETKVRYAVIKTAKMPKDGEFLFQGPFNNGNSGRRSSGSLELSLMRGFWQDVAPKTDAALYCNGLWPWTGFWDEGRERTTTDEVFIGNYQENHGLGTIFVNDGGVFGANLQTAGPPYALLPAVPAVNDAVYFGHRNAQLEPFHALVFNLTPAATQLTITWEYYNGAAWAALPVYDETVGFTVTGVHSVVWNMWSLEALWHSVAINGVTTYWIRARVSAIGGAPTPPTQITRRIYSPSRNYINVEDTDLLGDLPAKLHTKFHIRGAGTVFGVDPDFSVNRLVLGMRSLSRGADFQSSINLGDRSNPAGIVISLGAVSAYAVSAISAVGRAIDFIPAASIVQTIATVDFTLTSITQYRGDYHIYLRGNILITFAGDLQIRLRANNGGYSPDQTSEWVTVPLIGTREQMVVDMGTFSLVEGDFSDLRLPLRTRLVIEANVTNFAGVAYCLLDTLVFIPVDEWSGDFIDTVKITGSTITLGTTLDIDSARDPKVMIQAVKGDPTLGFDSIYQAQSTSEMVLQAGADQRLWGLSMYWLGTPVFWWFSDFQAIWSVQLYKISQYLSMRGTT